MKTKHLFSTAVLAVSFFISRAQNEIPAGFANGSVILADGEVLEGFVKDNLKRSASVVFIDRKGTNKKTYKANQVNEVTIDAAKYISISGDFFKTLSTGKMNFLQKASHASGSFS